MNINPSLLAAICDTPGVQFGPFRVGEAYYQCYVNSGKVIVHTWTFAGYKQSRCNSTSCEIPYHFYEFKLRHGDGSLETKCTIDLPTLKHAERLFLTFDRLCEEFEKARLQIQNP